MTDATTSDARELIERLASLQRDHSVVVQERDRYKHLAELLQKELERLRDEQKTPREHVDSAQIQLAFAELAKELLTKLQSKQPEGAQGAEGASPPPEKKKRNHTPHGRSVLPEHLPVETLVFAIPPGEGRTVIGVEVSWRLGFRPAQFYRLKIVRQVAAVLDEEADAIVATATLHRRDVSGLEGTAADPSAKVEAAAQVEPTKVEDTETTAPTDVVGRMPCESSATTVASGGERKTIGRDTTVICVAAADEMIPRGLPTHELLAHVLTAKFADKMPFRRQEGIYARQDIHITAGTMCGWAERCHERARHVVEAMLADAKANAHVIATDATGVLVQANEKCKRGHFWVFVADRDHVIFRYTERHRKEEPLGFFKGFKGVVLADASSVYDALFNLPDGPTEAGCWSHARRYFYKAMPSDRERALIGVGFANKLFDVERDIKKLSPAQRLELRQERSRPIIDAYDRWRGVELEHPAVADGTSIRRAFQYSLNHWTALCRFLEDGRVPIHNNQSELELRRMVVGRANWLFVGSDDSAAWTCTFVSLVASCQLHELDPEAYLRDLFRVLPSWPMDRMLELAPKFWRASRAQLREVELEMPLGPITVPPVATAVAGPVVATP